MSLWGVFPQSFSSQPDFTTATINTLAAKLGSWRELAGIGGLMGKSDGWRRLTRAWLRVAGGASTPGSGEAG